MMMKIENIEYVHSEISRLRSLLKEVRDIVQRSQQMGSSEGAVNVLLDGRTDHQFVGGDLRLRLKVIKELWLKPELDEVHSIITEMNKLGVETEVLNKEVKELEEKYESLFK